MDEVADGLRVEWLSSLLHSFSRDTPSLTVNKKDHRPSRTGKMIQDYYWLDSQAAHRFLWVKQSILGMKSIE